MLLASIPSPGQGVIHLGPLPLRAYAFFILLGALLAVYFGDKRWVARGGRKGFVADIAATAVPAGLVGARLYHVITSPERYLEDPLEALYIWHGGLGIWGGIAGGALGAWWVLRRNGVAFLPFADALAPCLPLAQAVGRIGNYFNQELYGRATDLPWALEIDAEHSPTGRAGLYHPTFLYELLWNLGVVAVVLWADRKWQLARGRAFAVYVAAYCVGRFWIEALRIDEANEFLGLRLNEYVSGALLLGAIGYLVATRGATREVDVQPDVQSAT